MSYWAVARLEPHREQLALHCLGLAGYETYFPGLRETHGRKIEVLPPLFPGYCFLTVEAQWYAARWSLGVIGLIMDGIKPARVADHIIDELRKRERNGLIELPRRPALQPGDQVRILQGPFAGQLGLYAGISRAGAGVAGAARWSPAGRAGAGRPRSALGAPCAGGDDVLCVKTSGVWTRGRADKCVLAPPIGSLRCTQVVPNPETWVQGIF